MAKEIIINVGAHEKRIAVVEDGRLEEFLVEKPDQERIVGNIYLGVVQSVQAGMQAAFVDIGFDKAAFLSASDVETSSIQDDENADPAGSFSPPYRSHYGIEKILYKGQNVLVQIIKEPIGTKGPKVSMQISFPGRFVVLLSGTGFIGISKRTKNMFERRNLKEFIASVKPDGVGVIVRTIGLEAEEEDFKNEIKILYDKYVQVKKIAQKSKGPRLLYKEIGLAASVMRDLFTPDIAKVVVDSKIEFKEIRNYLKTIDPEMRDRIYLYRDKTSLFDFYGIEKEVDKIMRRKVWLRNGGYLIFDHTEALVAIDVNSGRFISKRNQEETAFRTNLEAVKEVARQIRLRDIGGLLVIDLIDMERHEHREHIYRDFCQAMKRDKAVHYILPINEFGFIELSRKRVRPEVMQIMSEICPTCGGTGNIFSATTVMARIDRCLHRNMAAKGKRKLQLEISYTLAEHFNANRRNILKRLMKDNRAKIEILVNEEYNTDEFHIYETETGEDITERLIN